jgi:hypothetical protein
VPKHQRREVLDNFANAWGVAHQPLPQDFAVAKPGILPMLCERTHFEIQRLQVNHGEPTPQSPHRVWAEHFGFSLVYNLQVGWRTITPPEFDRWGISFDDAAQVAMNNLTEISQSEFESPAPGVWMSPWHDYAAARLMLPAVVRRHEVTLQWCRTEARFS